MSLKYSFTTFLYHGHNNWLSGKYKIMKIIVKYGNYAETEESESEMDFVETCEKKISDSIRLKFMQIFFGMNRGFAVCIFFTYNYKQIFFNKRINALY